ncbi:hypothetical protein [Nonlabens ponticola]|uniref:hypothetical protein n=1 Tax=Nonlabens ponticola TaxID=2496866 RepID=UPI0019D2129C|nr:hypothetical protein [Nonlabens ponticola]
MPSSLDYVKDINDILDPLVGKWSGIANGKSYELNIEKYRENSADFAMDILGKQHKIIDLNTDEVIEDTFNVSIRSKRLRGHGITQGRNGNWFYDFFQLKSSECYIYGNVFITKIDDNTLKLFFQQYGSSQPTQEDCPSGFNQLYPDNMILTRVE